MERPTTRLSSRGATAAALAAVALVLVLGSGPAVAGLG
jgi:hypothetical protein